MSYSSAELFVLCFWLTLDCSCDTDTFSMDLWEAKWKVETGQIFLWGPRGSWIPGEKEWWSEIHTVIWHSLFTWKLNYKLRDMQATVSTCSVVTTSWSLLSSLLPVEHPMYTVIYRSLEIQIAVKQPLLNHIGMGSSARRPPTLHCHSYTEPYMKEWSRSRSWLCISYSTTHSGCFQSCHLLLEHLLLLLMLIIYANSQRWAICVNVYT